MREKYLLLLLALIFLSPSLSVAQSFSIRALKASVKFKTNPFLRDCRGILQAPPLRSGRIQMIPRADDQDLGTLYMSFQVRPGYSAFVRQGQVLFGSDGQMQSEKAQYSDAQDIPLVPDDKKVASLSLDYRLRDQMMRLPLVFRFSDGAPYVAYLEIKMLEDGKIAADLIPVVDVEKQKGLCLRSQVWLGIGGSAFIYQQSFVEKDGSAKFTSLSPFSYSAEIKYFPYPEWGLVAGYKSAPGEIKSGAISGVRDQNFRWNILMTEAQYRPYGTVFQTGPLTFYPFFKAGIQSHELPRLALDNSENVSIESMKFLNGHLGVGVNVVDKSKYFFEGYINYQSLLQSQEYQLAPRLMFDGSIGAGKMIGKKWAIGLFWYGQSHEIDYKQSTGTDTSPGRIRFTFSNIDARIGFVF